MRGHVSRFKKSDGYEPTSTLPNLQKKLISDTNSKERKVVQDFFFFNK